MSAINYNDLEKHIGHKIVCVGYGLTSIPGEIPYYQNVALECEDCSEILLDYDKE